MILSVENFFPLKSISTISLIFIFSFEYLHVGKNLGDNNVL